MSLNRIVLSGKHPTTDSILAGEIYSRIAYNISYPEANFFLSKEPSKEIKFIYEYFKLDLPKNISKAKIDDETEFVLVGHNKESQISEIAKKNMIIAVIDNHPVEFSSQNQIYFRSEPVGSTCTIITEMLLEHAQIIPTDVAKLLVAGIVSETYLFTASLTKALDRQMVDRLNKIAQIVNIKIFAEKLFEKKADLTGQDVEDILSEPLILELSKKKIFIREIFTPKPEKTLERKKDFIQFLKKSEKTEEISIIAIIDIVSKATYFLTSNNESQKIIEDSMMFGERIDENEYRMQGVSSVEKEIIPAIDSLLG